MVPNICQLVIIGLVSLRINLEGAQYEHIFGRSRRILELFGILVDLLLQSPHHSAKGQVSKLANY